MSSALNNLGPQLAALASQAPTVLAQFKRLCRHYWALDPVATARHVHAYRDMWDGEGADSAEAGGAGV
jgi:hypothetical protein